MVHDDIRSAGCLPSSRVTPIIRYIKMCLCNFPRIGIGCFYPVLYRALFGNMKTFCVSDAYMFSAKVRDSSYHIFFDPSYARCIMQVKQQIDHTAILRFRCHLTSFSVDRPTQQQFHSHLKTLLPTLSKPNKTQRIVVDFRLKRRTAFCLM